MLVGSYGLLSLIWVILLTDYQIVNKEISGYGNYIWKRKCSIMCCQIRSMQINFSMRSPVLIPFEEYELLNSPHPLRSERLNYGEKLENHSFRKKDSMSDPCLPKK
jgi:hypothetical protein